MEQKKVTKFDLVESVYLETNCEKKTVQTVLESILENIKSSLKDGATIELRGFGTFEPRLRKGRSRARNPKTGEPLTIAAAKTPKFRAGKALKDAL